MSPITYIIIAAVVIIAAIIIVVLKNYRKVGPNEVLIVSGGKKRMITLPEGRLPIPHRRWYFCTAVYRAGAGTAAGTDSDGYPD